MEGPDGRAPLCARCGRPTTRILEQPEKPK